jgi:hypothetical protein
MPGKAESPPVPESAKPGPSIRKGCLPALALYGLPAIAYYCLFHFVFAAELGELDWAAALGAGLLTVIGLSLVFFGGDWRLLGASSSGMPADGQRIAVCGRLKPLTTALRAPFSHTDCVAYNYGISHTEWRTKTTVSVPHFAGLALTPSAVDSELGRIRILTFPIFERFGAGSDPRWLDNARQYVETTTFEEAPEGAILSDLTSVRELVTNDSGSVRRDTRYIAGSDLAKLDLSEMSAGMNEEVCLIGLYSAERSGVIRDTKATRLIRGSRNDVRRLLLRERIGHMILGIVLVAIPAALVAWAFTRHSHP